MKVLLVIGVANAMELRERNHFRAEAGSNLPQESDAALKVGLTDVQGQTPLRPGPQGWVKLVALAIPLILIVGLVWLIQANPANQSKVTSNSGLAELGIVYAGSTFQAGEKRRAGLPAAEGLLITEVKSGGPAEQAGLRAGDLIIEINGMALKASDSLLAVLNRYRPGDKVTLTLLREAERRKMEVRLGQLK